MFAGHKHMLANSMSDSKSKLCVKEVDITIINNKGQRD